MQELSRLSKWFGSCKRAVKVHLGFSILIQIERRMSCLRHCKWVSHVQYTVECDWEMLVDCVCLSPMWRRYGTVRMMVSIQQQAMPCKSGEFLPLSRIISSPWALRVVRRSGVVKAWGFCSVRFCSPIAPPSLTMQNLVCFKLPAMGTNSLKHLEHWRAPKTERHPKLPQNVVVLISNFTTAKQDFSSLLSNANIGVRSRAGKVENFG